jgi:hypothetical protein
MPRDKYVERCKQRALDYLDRGDAEKAVTSIITTMDARIDCKLPHYLVTIGISLLKANDRRAIENIRRRAAVGAEGNPGHRPQSG